MFTDIQEKERIRQQILSTLSIPSEVSVSNGIATIKLGGGRVLKAPYTGGGISTFSVYGKTYFTVGNKIIEIP